MGQSLSHISDDIDQQKIYHSMKKKAECKEPKMYIDALNDECLPIVCAVDKFRDFLADVKFKSDEKLLGEIKNRLEKHLSGDYLDELIKLMTGVLKGVLTSSIADGEAREVSQIHVVYANRSVLRIDYFVYWQKYDCDKMALFFYVQIGVIDMERVRLPVLIYELTRATDDNKLNEIGKKLKEVAQSIILLNEAAQSLVMAARRKTENATNLPPSPASQFPGFMSQRQPYTQLTEAARNLEAPDSTV
ncbi:uncharacterized protein [Montipora foliosa]|uniref:uncharacterized protein n=1 Tax=Montipora foliosa TaxID=591990 RepID=UPI0035F12EB6